MFPERTKDEHMTTLFTLKLTDSGREAWEREQLFDGFNIIHVLAILNWRSRHFGNGMPEYNQDDKLDSVSIHDEEWVCHSPDKGQGHIFSISGAELQATQEAIESGFYRVS